MATTDPMKCVLKLQEETERDARPLDELLVAETFDGFTGEEIGVLYAFMVSQAVNQYEVNAVIANTQKINEENQRIMRETMNEIKLRQQEALARIRNTEV